MEPITLALLFAFQPISGNVAQYEVPERVLWAEQVSPRVLPAQVVDTGSSLRLETLFESWEMTGVVPAPTSTPTVALCDEQLTAFVAGWQDGAPVVAIFGGDQSRTISLDGDPVSSIVPIDSAACEVAIVDAMGTLHQVSGAAVRRFDDVIDFVPDADELERGVALSYFDGHALVGDRERGLTAIDLTSDTRRSFGLSDRVVPGFVADHEGEGVWLTTRDGNLWFWNLAQAPELIWPGSACSATGLTSATCGDTSCLLWGTERGDLMAFDGVQADVIVSVPEAIRAPIVVGDLLDAGSPQWVVTTTQARGVLVAWTDEGPSSSIFSTGYRASAGLGLAQIDESEAPRFIVPTLAHTSLEVPAGDVGASPLRGDSGSTWPGVAVEGGRVVAMSETDVDAPELPQTGDPIEAEPEPTEPEPTEPPPWEAVEDTEQPPPPRFDDYELTESEGTEDSGPDFWALEPTGPVETAPVPQGPSCSAAGGTAPSPVWLLLGVGLLARRRRG